MKNTQLLIGFVLLITVSILTGCEDGGTGALPHHEFDVVDKDGNSITFDAVATLVGDVIPVVTIQSVRANLSSSFLSDDVSLSLTFNDEVKVPRTNSSGDSVAREATVIGVKLAKRPAGATEVVADALVGGNNGPTTGPNSVTVSANGVSYLPVSARIVITEMVTAVRRDTFFQRDITEIVKMTGYVQGEFRSLLPALWKPSDGFPTGYDPRGTALYGNVLRLHSCRFSVGNARP